MKRNIIYFLLFVLLLTSCGKNYIKVEMKEQKKNLISKLDYKIYTTMGTFNLKNESKQIIFLNGEIENMGISSIEFKKIIGQYNRIGETSYFSQINRRIVIYFYLIKYGTIKINDLNTILKVEPFNNFKGIYTEKFIYNDNLYQVISKNPEIKLNEFVEEFDYNRLLKSQLSQYKIIRKYTEKDEKIEKEENKNGKYSFHVNYIFPEENNPEYIKYRNF